MKKLYFILVMTVTVLISGCSVKNRPYTADGKYFDTYVKVSVYGGSQEIVNSAMELCDYYENIFSVTKPEALLYKLNKTGSMQIVTEEDRHLHELVKTGLDYSREFDGCFDISVEPVSVLWKKAISDCSLPDNSQIADGLAQVGCEKIEVTDDEIRLNGARLDLGSLAKGYVADRIKEYLESRGVVSGIINLGGNILCLGKKSDGSDFKIGIKKPFGKEQDVMVTLKINDMSVVTTGIYERYFMEKGELYHHIIDVRTGFPCKNNLYSVTIISPDSTQCDCLSTACFIMGKEKALEYINKTENTYAIIIDENMNIYYSNGAQNFVVQ